MCINDFYIIEAASGAVVWQQKDYAPARINAWCGRSVPLLYMTSMATLGRRLIVPLSVSCSGRVQCLNGQSFLSGCVALRFVCWISRPMFELRLLCSCIKDGYGCHTTLFLVVALCIGECTPRNTQSCACTRLVVSFAVIAGFTLHWVEQTCI